MNIVIGSAFRNMGARVMPYLEQVAALRDTEPGLNFRVIAVEGDSTDNTREALTLGARYHKLDLDLVTCNHGQRVFGSTEEPERLAALSRVGNAIFDAVRCNDDVLVYVESDLRWDPETMLALVADVLQQPSGFDIFSPKVMAGAAFYDIWGFRGLNGERWSPFNPYHREVQDLPFGGCYIEMSSVGSCLVMRGAVARQCRIRNDYCLVGWCEDARARGFRIAARLDLRVDQS